MGHIFKQYWYDFVRATEFIMSRQIYFAKTAGITLIELLVAIAIMGINDYLQSNRQLNSLRT